MFLTCCELRLFRIFKVDGLAVTMYKRFVGCCCCCSFFTLPILSSCVDDVFIKLDNPLVNVRKVFKAMAACYPGNMPYNSSVSGKLSYYVYLVYILQISFNTNTFLDFTLLKVKDGHLGSVYQTNLHYKETNK